MLVYRTLTKRLEVAGWNYIYGYFIVRVRFIIEIIRIIPYWNIVTPRVWATQGNYATDYG